MRAGVYVYRASRNAGQPRHNRGPHAGHRPLPAVGRRDRGADGQRCAGLGIEASKFNDSFKNPIGGVVEQLEPPALRIGAQASSGPDNATALGHGPCDARGLPADCPGAPLAHST